MAVICATMVCTLATKRHSTASSTASLRTVNTSTKLSLCSNSHVFCIPCFSCLLTLQHFLLTSLSVFCLALQLYNYLPAGAIEPESAPADTAEDAAQLAAIQALSMPGDAPKQIRIPAAPAATVSLQAVGAQAPKDRFWDCACTKDATKSPAGTSPWSCSCALAKDAAPTANAKPAQPAPKADAQPVPAPLKAEQPKPAAPKADAAPKPAPQKQQQQPKAVVPAPKPAAPKVATPAPKPQEAPKPKADIPKVVKAINVVAPKPDAQKPEAPKAAAPMQKQQQQPKPAEPVAEQPKVVEPQPAAQQPAPVQTPSQQEPLAQPVQPAQPAGRYWSCAVVTMLWFD